MHLIIYLRANEIKRIINDFNNNSNSRNDKKAIIAKEKKLLRIKQLDIKIKSSKVLLT